MPESRSCLHAIRILHRLALPIALALAVALPVALPAQADEERATQSQLKKLRGEIAELSRLLQGFRDERSKLQGSLRSSEVEIGEIQKRMRTIQQQLEEQQRELERLNEQRDDLQSSRRQQAEQIEKQVRGAYQLGRQHKIKVLLNQENPDTVSRALAYYDYFNRARSERIEAYVDLISELDHIEPRIRQQVDTLAVARGQLQQQQSALVDARAQRQQSLARLEATIQNKDQELKAKANDRAELEKLLSAMQETLANLQLPADYRPFAELKGKLPWPVNGRTAHRFGSLREGSELRWQGVTINAGEGETVQAIHNGRVVFADWFRGAGLLLILDHGNGYMSLYGHNQSLLRDVGDWIATGEPIATVGSSGGNRQAGLYFEIRHNGRPTDPGQWCQRA